METDVVVHYFSDDETGINVEKENAYRQVNKEHLFENETAISTAFE